MASAAAVRPIFPSAVTTIMPALQMRNGVVVDSGPLLALFDRDDAHHARVRQALKRNQGLHLLTTWPVLTETSALLS